MLFPSTCILYIGKDEAMYMLAFDTFFYFILYLYFDQVLPNEYGTHKSPLFFLNCRKKTHVQNGHLNMELSLPFVGEDPQNLGDLSEDTSSANFH